MDRVRSQTAEAARRSLNEDIKRMTPEQRLAAFLAHCQLMVQLGERRRGRPAFGLETRCGGM